MPTGSFDKDVGKKKCLTLKLPQFAQVFTSMGTVLDEMSFQDSPLGQAVRQLVINKSSLTLLSNPMRLEEKIEANASKLPTVQHKQ